MRAMLALLFLLALAPLAVAADGVLEINQTCALNTGCFSGDAAGYPVTISSTGRSFVVTSRLFVSDENTDVIVVSAASVSIDLNGFEIDGPVTCAGDPLVCTPSSGTGSGVEVVSTSGNVGVSVKNGSITGMGSSGVRLGDQAEVANLRVRWSGNSGISTGIGSTITNNTVYQSGNDGIRADSGSTVSGNTAYSNAGSGIDADAGSTIQGNSAYENDVIGIYGGIGASIVDNAVAENVSTGIRCENGCSIRGNTVRSNGHFGLSVGADTAYVDNVVTGNSTGTVTGVGSANSRGGNYCAGTGTGAASCP